MSAIKNEDGQIVGYTLDDEGKGPSMYDIIIDDFLKNNNHVRVHVKGRSGRYLQTQLRKRIQAKGLEDRVKAYSKDDIAYLIRVYPPPTSVMVV